MPKGKHVSFRDVDKPFEEWCRPEHFSKAKELLEFFKNFKGNIALKPWDSVTHEGESYTCWYVSFLDADTYVDEKGLNKLCIALHFNMVKNKRRCDVDVFFRFMDVVKKGELKLSGWHNAYKNCEYVSFEKNRDKLVNAMSLYLKNLRKHFDNRTLRNFQNFALSDISENP